MELKASTVRIPGLRKTVLCVDQLLSNDECAALLAESYQPCHGGYKRFNSAVTDVRDTCCRHAGTTAVVVQDATLASLLWSRLETAVPERCVPVPLPSDLSGVFS
jgi:hypothetical protein